jgi:hypothetical protein
VCRPCLVDWEALKLVLRDEAISIPLEWGTECSGRCGEVGRLGASGHLCMAFRIHGGRLSPKSCWLPPQENRAGETEARGGEFSDEGIPRCGTDSVNVRLADFTNQSAMMILPA